MPSFNPAFNHLTEVYEFGSNPGALRMFKYVPARPKSALVVVLHGCKQTAANYDLGAGWSTLAAVKDSRVLGLSDDIASRWGPRIVDLLQMVSDELKLHPSGSSS